MQRAAAESPAPTPASAGWVLLAALLGTACLLAYRLPHLHGALFSDESHYLLLAALVKSGGVPYRDLWDFHAPGMELLLALLPDGLLRAEAAVRLVSVATLGATLYFTADMLRRSGVGLLAIYAGALGFTLYHCLDWFAALYLENEQIMVLTLTLMVWSLWTKKNPAWAWFFWGLTTLFKQTGVLFLPLLMLLDCSDPRRRGACGMKGILQRAAAASAPWLAVMAGFALKGGFRELIDGVLLEALTSRARITQTYCAAWFRWEQVKDYEVLLIGCAALALSGAPRLLRDAEKRRPLMLGVLWLASAMLYLRLQRCGLWYYYAIASPGLMWLTAWAFDWNRTLHKAAASPLQRLMHWLLLLLLGIGVALPATRLRDNHLPTRLSGTIYAHNARWLARQMRDRLHGRYQVLAVQDYPAWYWYLEQPPPRVQWLPFYLSRYPDQREPMVRSAAEYGRGKPLLLVYFQGAEAPQPEIEGFRARTRALGARPVSLAGLLGMEQLPDGFNADLWDPRDCAASSPPCVPPAAPPQR